MRSRSRVLALPLLLALAGLSFAAVSFAAAWWRAGSLHQPVDPPPEGFPAEDVAFSTADGVTLRGWWAPGADARAAIILLHGRGDTRRSMLPRARFLREAGFSCLLYDARAHGESGGSITGLGALEVADLAAAVDFVRQNGVEWIGCLGFSQGAATILLAAPERPEIRAAVVEASYPTLRIEIDHGFRRRVGMPGWLAGALFVPFTQWRTGVDIDTIRPIDGIARMTCPVLVVGGTADRAAYEADTRALYDAAQGPKDLWIIEGAEHEDLHRYAGTQYEVRIRRFFETAMTPGASLLVTD